MSDKREEVLAVLRERKAFRDGVNYATTKEVKAHPSPAGPCFYCDNEAAKRYPLPKVTRPRVWIDNNGREFRFVDGQIQTRAPHTDVTNYGKGWVCLESGLSVPPSEAPRFLRWTPARIHAIADLIANPTEEVEEGA